MTRLTRRELLYSMLGAPVASAALAACEEDVEDREVSGEMLGPRMDLGHTLRDEGAAGLGAWDGAPERRVGIAILGGGPAGLAAAWRLHRGGHRDYAVFELEDRPGGKSIAGRSEVTAYPWAAHYLPVPMAHNRDLIALLEEMDVLVGTDEEGQPVAAEHLMVREPAERLFLNGFWQEGLYPYAGASREDRAELRRFLAELDRLVALRDGQGRRAFAIPVAAGSDDADIWALDRISAAEWLAREGYRSPRLRWLLEYGCRDDYALTLETASAWAALWYYAARMPGPGRSTMPLVTWPEGNGAIVQHLAGVAGDRMQPGYAIVDVEPRDDGVRVRVLRTEDRQPQTVIAERVVVAMPRFVARHVVRPLREAPPSELDAFRYGPWMVANLHLADRPSERGFPACWDNVLYDSPSLGYVSATHQRGRDFGPTVWTYYLPLTDGDPAAGRRRLLAPDWEGWRDVIVADLSRAHPDLAKHLERVDVWRWGHGMIQPRVGFVSGEARRRASEPVGRIHFAHSDLSGVAVFEEAFFHGVRAADEVLATRSGGGEARTETDAEAPT